VPLASVIETEHLHIPLHGF